MDSRGCPPETYDSFVKEFEGVEFERLGFTPKMQKQEFLEALWQLRQFNARHFSFERLCAKIFALLRYSGGSDGIIQVIQFWIYWAIVDLARGGGGTVDGDVLGTAGEISGIYETIFKRNTTLAGIKLGRFANIQLAVFDKGEDFPVKVFDAVSVDHEKEIVTVFEFKFTLTLRKLYQQVIGIDSATNPHLAVLKTHREFRHVRNLVYFGEVADERLTEAISHHLANNPRLGDHVRLTDRGFSIKLPLPEASEFLCDPKTVALAQQFGKPFIASDPSSAEYRDRIDHIRAAIGESTKLLHARGTGKFDVIIAVSNATEAEFVELKSALRRE